MITEKNGTKGRWMSIRTYIERERERERDNLFIYLLLVVLPPFRLIVISYFIS